MIGAYQCVWCDGVSRWLVLCLDGKFDFSQGGRPPCTELSSSCAHKTRHLHRSACFCSVKISRFMQTDSREITTKTCYGYGAAAINRGNTIYKRWWTARIDRSALNHMLLRQNEWKLLGRDPCARRQLRSCANFRELKQLLGFDMLCP